MHFFEFERRVLTGRELPPIYVFCGEEHFFKHKGIELIKKRYGVENGIIAVRFLTSEVDISKIVDELYTPQLIGGRKLVIVEVDEKDANNIDNIWEWLNSIDTVSLPQSSVLVLLADKVNLANINKKATVVECKGISDEELKRWIKSAITERKKNISPDALSELCNRHSKSKSHDTNNLRLLFSDIEKICLSVGGRQDITVDDITLLSGKDIDYHNFMLVDAIQNGDVRRAMGILRSRVRDGESEEAIIGAITWGYKQMVEAKLLLEKGMSKYDVASVLRFPIKIDINRFTSIISKYSIVELKDKISNILEADLMLKTSGESSSIILELLIYKLAGVPLSI